MNAVDFTRPEDKADRLDARLTSALARLKFYGNNGYGPPFDRQQAARILDDLRAADLLDRDVVLGAMAAQGVSPNRLTRLGQLIDTSSGR
ncbi:hypothetical protein [Streptomyces mirabilis]|uniref:Uncharacterized protein n=1 Tax=Streptomyces mirabilis TaxID=68239 RepID=A0A1I2WJC9_9ACTN|nr:hypothetical protein [Streptomyces mirabilis]SFH01418.1 hypothetical protein SAMN02787118_1383 [Streptomyces mirabilis]SFH02074.1 hypothetical protein SAMN02787118_13841 [Streptomyces mirabilis]